MARKSRFTAIGVMVCMAVFVPAMLAIVSPASAALTLLANLDFTNLTGLPEGTINYGTVSSTGTGLEWQLNSFSSGGLTYTAVGVDNVCWQNTTTTGSVNCDGFGHNYTLSASSGASPPFVNPFDNTTTDTTANFAAHVKWTTTSSNGTFSCTGFIGNTTTTSNDSANDCLGALPEPGTASLMLAGIPGLVGMAAIGRWRRRARPTS